MQAEEGGRESSLGSSGYTAEVEVLSEGRLQGWRGFRGHLAPGGDVMAWAWVADGN